MGERQFDEDEARKIFERAAKAEVAPREEPGTGLTLRQLQEIGAEVGLSADSIAHAAASLDAVQATGRVAQMGLPVGLSRTVALGRTMSDTEWDHLVGELRHTFRARGNTEVGGRFREWWNGNLRVSVEATPTGDVLHMSTLKSGARETLWMGLGMAGLAAVLWVLLALTGELAADPDTILIPLMFGSVGIGMLIANTLRLPPWFRQRAAQFESLARSMLPGTTAPEVRGPDADARVLPPSATE